MLRAPPAGPGHHTHRTVKFADMSGPSSTFKVWKNPFRPSGRTCLFSAAAVARVPYFAVHRTRGEPAAIYGEIPYQSLMRAVPPAALFELG